jgi:hypothetical protein
VAGVQTFLSTSPGNGGSQGWSLYISSLLQSWCGRTLRGYRLLAVPILAVADLCACNYSSLLCYRVGTGDVAGVQAFLCISPGSGGSLCL